jgi:glycosyltransferase involved in cell wall biosynthesis
MAVRKTRILLLVTSTAGGTGQHAYQLASRLPRESFEIDAAFGPGYPLDQPFRDLRDVTVHELTLSRRLAPFRNLAVIGHLYRLMKARRYDVVCIECSVAGLVGRIAAKVAGVPVTVFVLAVFASHPHQPRVSRTVFGMLERLMRPLTTHFVAVSNHMRDFGVGHGLVDPNRVTVIYNGVGVDTSRDDRRAARAALGLTADAPVIGTLARFEPQKDLEVMIRAMQVVHTALPDAQLVLIGDGPLRPQLEALTREEGLGGCIRFAGWRQDAAALLPAMDVFCSTSRWESFGLAHAEAMAHGLATVATAVDGVPEVVENGVTGLLAPAGDADAVGRALVELLNDRKRREAMGAAGRERVTTLFAIDTMVSAYARLFGTLVAEQGGPRGSDSSESS